MAKQTINLGSGPNIGDGDPARTAFDKTNDNFDELYAFFDGGGSGAIALTASGVQNVYNKTYYDPIFVGSITGIDKVDIGLPNVDNTTDLNKPISTATQGALDLKTNLSLFVSHTGDLNNPHAVTAGQIGLGNVNNTSDANKPISTATQIALDLKTNQTGFAAHLADLNNPHVVTKTQVGLGNVDNTSDANKPISATASGVIYGHINNVSNPHSVTKAQVGLANVDNTSDLAKPLSTAASGVIYGHIVDTANPHLVTKTQVGLGNVDNTSDLNKPLSTATIAALTGKFDNQPGLVYSTGTNTLSTTSFSADAYKVTSNTVVPVAGPYVASNSDNGKILTFNAAGYVILPVGLISGFSCLISSETTGTVYATGSGSTLQSFLGYHTLAGQYSSATIWQKSPDIYRLDGNLL